MPLSPSLALQVQEILRTYWRPPVLLPRSAEGDLACRPGRQRVHKRLKRGRFIWSSLAEGVVTISSAQLGYLLSGIDWQHPQETCRPTSVG
ncbi:IS66 family insertion sequence element accessory protein TnpB [Bradyrhizobium sp. DASA03007]|uniref:IS66 family insertion sequence element accessory protein TnpB n=1 Tax=unclassified Bradyrhizobium TaxID=2631580 RepID=UPI003F72198F